jgi:hypothetical protein
MLRQLKGFKNKRLAFRASIFVAKWRQFSAENAAPSRG